MPVLLLILVALISGTGAGLAMLSLGRRPTVANDAAVVAGRKLADSAQTHPALRSALRRRLDPERLTGLALSIGLAFVACAGVVLGLLAYLVRTSSSLAELDNGIARWGERHASRTFDTRPERDHAARIDLRGARALRRPRGGRALPDA